VILYSMIVKDERDNYEIAFDYDIVEGTAPKLIVNHEHYLCYETYFQIYEEIRNRNAHATLQANLIKDIWKRNSRRQHRSYLNNSRIVIFLNVQLL